MSIQRNGKYSCMEWERRFLVRALPMELVVAGYRWRISDRYLPGTRLRLRRMEAPSGVEVHWKLTQKFQEEGMAGRRTTITNIYLSEAEYESLQVLGGNEIRKDRYLFEYRNNVFGFDVFAGRHRGLILAEVEAESDTELDRIPIPPFLLEEVTEEPFFTGGKLAEVPTTDFQRTLQLRLGRLL